MKKDIILKAEAPSPLLEFMRRELKNLPSGRVKSFLEHRQVSVDGVVTTKFNFPLREGQVVKISMAQGASKDCGLDVIYEDEWIVAVNKPAGLLTVATDTEKLRTAYAVLRETRRGGIYVVHRLDRDTSGVLLFAKSEDVRDELQDRWDKLLARREYLAICEGVFDKKKGRCDTYLAENRAHVVYSLKDKEGKRAITNYEVTEENASYSAVRILLETGRKNQIRVHMKELGHPIVGDKKYGATGNPLGRLGLHAYKVELIHPVTGRRVEIKANPERKFRTPDSRKYKHK